MALTAADANALDGSSLTRLTVKMCGLQAASFISGAAANGALNKLERLVLMAPQQLGYRSVPPRAPPTYGTTLGIFTSAGPLPALTVLTIAGTDLGPPEWAGLTAPKLKD